MNRLFAVAVMLLAGSAHAQRGIDANIHRPALDAFGLITVERAEISRPWQLGFVANVDYASNPLRLGMTLDPASGAPVIAPILTRQTTVRLGMHLGLTSWLQASVELPMSAQQFSSSFGSYGAWSDPQIVRSGFYAGTPYVTVPPPDAAALDARLGLKARLLRARGFGLALLAVATLPFGDEASFLGDSGFTFQPTLVGDYTRGSFTVALNLGAIVRAEEIVYAPAEKATVPRALLDVGDELTMGAGARVDLGAWVALIAEAHALVPLVQRASGPLAPGRDITAEALAGVELKPTGTVRIKLGGGANVVPSAYRHADFRIFVGVSWAKPPSTGASRDRDGDGVPDTSDVCPDEPEDRDGFQDDDGCPDLDNDGDGIADAADRCPNEPETANGIDDDDGCPDSGGRATLHIADVIHFAAGSATPADEGVAAIARIAARLGAESHVRRVRVEGHADDFGSAHARNQTLSQARADKVRELLMARGVEGERLQAVGYGDTRAAAREPRARERGLNRRVEFITVEQ